MKKSIKVDLGKLSSEDAIILMMGVPGTGKSTFINNATNSDPESTVGHGLSPETPNIRAFRMSRNDRSIIFIDTPGFDNSNGKTKTERELLNLVADGLSRFKCKLSGIIYLHRISDNRLGTRGPLENSDIFERLFDRDRDGKVPYGKVVLATTMWGGPSKEKVELAREEELQKQYWHGMLQSGSKVMRFDSSPDSSWSVIESLQGWNV